MADQLATAADLATLPRVADLPTATADQLLQMATGIVQGIVGQRLIQVTGDTTELMGTTDSELWLPERPVTAVTSVEVDGEAVAEGTGYKRFGPRLRRSCGWSDDPHDPTTVTVVYDHGYPTDDYRLGFARSVVLMLAAGAASGPGVTSEGIDDYQVTYDKMAARMEAAETLTAALRRAYSGGARMVRVG